MNATKRRDSAKLGALLERSVKQHTAGQLDAAEAGYRQLVKAGAPWPAAYCNLALIHHGKGRLQEAVSLWRKALKLDDRDTDIALQLAATLKTLGKPEQSERCYRQALAINAELVPALYNLANLLQLSGEHAEAIGLYQRSLTLQPDLAEAWYNLGNSQRILGAQEKAASAYEEALKLRPDYAEALSNLGNVRRDQGDLNAAIEAYQQALATKPDYPDAHYNLGNALFESGEFAQAIPFFDRAGIRDAAERSLFCCYRTSQFDGFRERLPPLLEGDQRSPIVAALSAHHAINFDCEDRYRFCPNPLDHVYRGRIDALDGPLLDDLLQVLDLSEISARKQGRLHQGMQSSGNLFLRTEAPFMRLAAEVRDHFRRYREQFSDSDCSLIRYFPEQLDFESSWYVKMQQGGHLTSHIHETGWISGALYLQLPPRNRESDEGKIEFSLHGDDYPRLHENFPRRVVDIAVGDIVLFPSSLFHRTIEFNASVERICVAFDLSPAP